MNQTQILMYSGYVVVGFVLATFMVIFWLSRRKKKGENVGAASVNKVASFDDSTTDTHSINNKSMMITVAESSDQHIAGESQSGFFIASSAEENESSNILSTSLVLTSPIVNGLKFDDLLKAPAELLGRGKHGTLYKIVLQNSVLLAVKRIKDWEISSNDFKLRMQRLNQVKHSNVLPALAFYCSKQEKLLVYEYLQNGSMFRLLHGTQMGEALDWYSRLGIAATVAETLAFMHLEFGKDGIAHGNLKSSNILLNKNLEPCISEYGLVPRDNQGGLKGDVYGFGVILLELLTGKLVQNEGVDLATWVHSVVSEEWTGEVFDRSLISEGASEERLVNLLQVAIKCVNRSPESRPSLKQVAVMISTLKEEEDRSICTSVSVFSEI